ncbi:Hypothetical predicted protein [Lecanosticta acicola]|uniref:DUF1993 domain-containing protein n=1 Tax=Lecanosticta acicola TaxID=111012 RepID=A0AAI8Z3C6_9PEZI|nr:Hypothetical predicted protein [Lecanosticta acicola]
MSSSSSSLNLYDLSVPIFTRALESQLAFLKKGEQWCKDNNVDPEKLIQGRIAPDMLPLPFQVQSCCKHSTGVLQRLGGATPPPPPSSSVENNNNDDDKSFADLYARLESAIAQLKTAKKAEFAAPEATCKVQAGPREFDFNNLAYVQNFALPNFFFHSQTAYLILRKEGVPVGKLDFLGPLDTLTGL